MQVDPDSAVPPYEQVRLQLARQIADGTLPAGAKLPPVRVLASELGLAVNTVARAYRELEAAGLVETRGRAGTSVRAGDRTREKVRAAAAKLAATARAQGVPHDEVLAIVRAALDG